MTNRAPKVPIRAGCPLLCAKQRTSDVTGIYYSIRAFFCPLRTSSVANKAAA